MSEQRSRRLLGACVALAVGLVTVVGFSAPAHADTPPDTPTWTAQVALASGGNQFVRAVCNAYLPHDVTNLEAGDGSATTHGGVDAVSFPTPYLPTVRFSCVSGYGKGLAGGSPDNARYGSVSILSGLLNSGGTAMLSDNEERPNDAEEGWYSGAVNLSGHQGFYRYARHAADWNTSPDLTTGFFNLSAYGGGSGLAAITWHDAPADPNQNPPMPTAPPEAVTAGVDPYVGPVYCDITNVTGDVSETVPKDPDQTYRYEISFAGRDGHTAAPDWIGLSAAWQENTPEAKLPYANITTLSPDAIQTEGDPWAGVAMWATPPLASPLVVEITFPEPKTYAFRIGCLSDDGLISYWVAGDLEPDPHTDEIFDDLRDQRLQECVPSGWGLLNPVAYARVTGCVFTYLFKPDLSEAFEPLTEAKDGSLVGQLVLVGGTVTDGVDALNSEISDSPTCEGPTVDLPGEITVKPLEACDGYPHTLAVLCRGFFTLALIVAVALRMLRLLGYGIDAPDPVQG